VVAVDFPLSHQFMYPPANHEGVTAAVLNGLSMMMLDVLAAIAHSDYLKRRERSAQGIAKAHAAGKYKGRQEDKERNLRIKKHLQTGAYSWNEVMAMEGVSRGTVAKVAKLMKVECALAVVA
jgi:DNA invertase Pin-like site-specific DNA recombinase